MKTLDPAAFWCVRIYCTKADVEVAESGVCGWALVTIELCEMLIDRLLRCFRCYRVDAESGGQLYIVCIK